MLKTSAELLSGFGPAVSSCEKLRFDPAVKIDPQIEIFNTQNTKMNWHAPNTSSYVPIRADTKKNDVSDFRVLFA